MKRIWRLSGVGHSNLLFVERITRKPPKEKALYPVYVAIITRGPEVAITTTAKRMHRVTEYVRQNADRLQRIQKTACLLPFKDSRRRRNIRPFWPVNTGAHIVLNGAALLRELAALIERGNSKLSAAPSAKIA